MLKLCRGLLLLMVLPGCQILSGPDVPATLRAENYGYVLEATAIAQTLQADRVRVQATAEAAATQAAALRNINQQLVVTVQAGDSPGVRRATDQTSGARRSFVQTGTSTRIRESDGCVEDAQVRFPAGTVRIYATAQAFNIQAGTQMRVTWYYGGTPVFQDSWVVPEDSSDLCIWFSIDPSEAELQEGDWSVRLYADGETLGEAVPFVIGESAMMEGG